MKGFRAGLAAALLVSAAFVAGPAQAADFRDFIVKTCGANCGDSVGETTRARENWTALQAMGTTQYVGASFGSSRLDASSLLAASRVAGPTELDRYLRTGQASSSTVMQSITGALTSGSGYNVGQIVGVGRQSSLAAPLTTILPTGLTQLVGLNGQPGMFMDAGGGGSNYCDPAVASSQNASAQNYVNNIMTVATGGEYGYSQNGGIPIAGGQRSAGGVFGTSCLSTFMQGAQDLLFRPPQLASLLTQLQSMFGSGATGCGAAPSVMQQVAGSMPNGVFGASAGGFFPHSQFGGGEGSVSGPALNFGNAFNLLTPGASSSGGATGSISTLFTR